MKKKKFRRKYIVNKKYQFIQVTAVLAANLLVALLIAMLLSWFYLFVLDGGVAVNHNQQVLLYLAGAILLIGFVSIFWSLRRSRAIAGMLKKLESILTQADNGVFPDKPITFRKGDYFTSLSTPLNSCITQLRERDHYRTVVMPAILALADKIASDSMDSKEVTAELTDIAAQFEGKNSSED